jgi:hypothetical protein
MLTIKNLEVKIFNLDISPIITEMIINESIYGDLSGHISIEDGVNLLDNVINKQTVLYISYEYLKNPIEISFYVDGVTDVSITRSSKKYIIHLESVTKLVKSNTSLNEVYNGKSHEILTKVFNTLYDEGMLDVISKTSTGGKYIAPNIPSAEVIDVIYQNAYDNNHSSMFLYQRLIDGGVTRLESHHDVLENSFDDEFKLRNKLVTDKDSNSIGTSSSFTVTEDNDDILNKISMGVYGMSSDIFNVEDTTFAKESDGSGLVAVGVIRRGLYDSNTPLLNSSLSTIHHRASSAKFRMFNVNMVVTNVVSVPGLSVGHTINIQQGGGNVSGSSYDGEYLVAGITNKMTLDGGEMFYSQDYRLVRES